MGITAANSYDMEVCKQALGVGQRSAPKERVDGAGGEELAKDGGTKERDAEGEGEPGTQPGSQPATQPAPDTQDDNNNTQDDDMDGRDRSRSPRGATPEEESGEQTGSEREGLKRTNMEQDAVAIKEHREKRGTPRCG